MFRPTKKGFAITRPSRSSITSILSIVSILSIPPLAAADNLDATFVQLESRWRDAMNSMLVPGMSVAVVYNGELVYAQGFGVRRLTPELPFTPDSACYVASSTKPFTGLGIMTLVDQGKVDLDKPVKSYLPKFDLPDHDLAQSITVRDLLTHRYGIDNQVITFGEAYSGNWDDDFFFRELPKSSAIKGSWQYSNLHFTIAGRIIEAVTGQPWQEYLRDTVFRPLGMNHTTARASELYADENVAIGLSWDRDHWIESPVIKIDKTMHAAGGMGGSARDFAQWLRFNMGDGSVDGKRIVSADTLARMFEPQLEIDEEFPPFDRGTMGLAWFIGGYRGETLIHHFGGYLGYSAHISFMPEHKLGVVALANSNRAASFLIHQVAADVYDRVLGLEGEDKLPALYDRINVILERERTEPDPALPDSPLTLSKPLDAYTGTFTSDRYGTLTLERNGDTLTGVIGNLRLSFYANEENRLTVDYGMGQEIAIFRFDTKGNMNEVRITGNEPYIMRFTR